MMAASIYATPPPDLNGEDTSVLSDTSNSSHTNSSNNSQHKAPKRSLLVSSPSTTTSLSTSSNNAGGGSGGGTHLFDSTPDLSKKRRKQTTPIRISATANELQQELTNSIASTNETTCNNNNNKSDNCNNNNNNIDNNYNNNINSSFEMINQNDSTTKNANPDEEKSLQKIFLKNLSQLQSQAHTTIIPDDSDTEPTISAFASTLSPSKHTTATTKSHSISPMSLSNPSTSNPEKNNNNSSTNVSSNHVHTNHNDQHLKIINDNKKDQGSNNLTDIENDIDVEYRSKFSANNLHDSKSNMDGSLSQKDENPWMENDDSKKALLSHDKPDKITKPEDWLSLAGLPFPFPPEAAAALSAYGQLPQLPLLSGPFGGADGVLSRGNAPPLRIFNPEAYCDLCNKEFCNKYFLKTHKANKHGIYEPPISGNDINQLSQLSQMQQMSQVLQMQQQSMQQQFSQQQQLQQNQSQSSPNNQNQSQSLSMPPNSNNQSDSLPSGMSTSLNTSPQEHIFCDICFKRFSNVQTLKKHRVKIHEMGNKNGETNKSLDESNAGTGDDSDRSTPFRMPDGFREDYQVEQEDTNFTPQPRKLSPSSMQQAKDANFSFDKLKRLGVINPEAFCELCCKEYCNKYFLRTHKLKRHGIFLPPDEMKDDQQQHQQQQLRTPWHYQTSPLNLIMASGELSALHLQAKKMEAAEAMKQSPELEFGEIKKENHMDLHKDNDKDENDKNRKSPMISLTQQESEAISVDLQKLQSMILQLNELNNHRNIPCAICGKEMENQYMLHAHMLSEHANLANNNNNNALKLSPRPSPVPSPNEFEICKHCDKEFSNIFMLKQHLIEMHGMAPMSPLREGFITPERPPTSGLSHPSTPTQMDRKPMFQMTPTSSYCEICNKELCNKYFMKTHMQRMHGIEIENGAQIGGVVCNICNKELCSKYFLRVHKHNTHGIVEDGSPLPQQTRTGGDSVDSDNGFPLDLKPGEVSDLSNRYYSHFTEVCPLCSRRFRSAKWLKAHLMSDHGKAGTDKLKEIESKVGPIKAPSPTLKIPNGAFNLNSPDGINSNILVKNPLSGLFAGENPVTSPTTSSGGIKGYQCSFCSFSTPILAILFIHERSHSGNSGINLSQNQIKSESAVSIAKEQLHTSQPTSGVSSSPTSTPASTPVPSTPQETIIGKPEYNSILNNMANLTQRPAIYALPQESGPLVMQSFLLEESSPSKFMANGKSGNIDNNKFVPSVVVLPVKERISSPITISFTLTPA